MEPKCPQPRPRSKEKPKVLEEKKDKQQLATNTNDEYSNEPDNLYVVYSEEYGVLNVCHARSLIDDVYKEEEGRLQRLKLSHVVMMVSGRTKLDADIATLILHRVIESTMQVQGGRYISSYSPRSS